MCLKLGATYQLLGSEQAFPEKLLQAACSQFPVVSPLEEEAKQENNGSASDDRPVGREPTSAEDYKPDQANGFFANAVLGWRISHRGCRCFQS